MTHSDIMTRFRACYDVHVEFPKQLSPGKGIVRFEEVCDIEMPKREVGTTN